MYICEADNAKAWGLAVTDGQLGNEKLLRDTEV